MCYDISFMVGFLSFVLHFVLAMHLISWHHSHCIGIVFIKLASARSCRSSLLSVAFVDCFETNHVFVSLLSNHLISLHNHRPLARVRDCPEPELVCCYHWIQFIPKHPESIIVLFIRLPSLFFSDRPIMIGRSKPILNSLFPYIKTP